ncbi:hypothetical protein GCM10020331_093280 [Ectobacillus funiculus]
MRNSLDEVKAYLKYGPIVLASEYVEDDSLPAVVIDNIKAAERVTEHLILKGHKRIGFINGPEHSILCRDRQKKGISKRWKSIKSLLLMI